MKIGILGAGAFGSALAIALARGGRDVTLWARKSGDMARNRRVPRLPGVELPADIRVIETLGELSGAPVLLAVPMQALADTLARPDFPSSPALVACCKGLDLGTGKGPTRLIHESWPDAQAAILTGPSFAADIARGLPTALTLASVGTLDDLQLLLSTPTLRIYSSNDPLGAEIGGAMKNVIAIACGIVIGAGLGQSARAALMTRGLVEIRRFAEALGARAETLSGLSGFGDLVLTCSSEQSRNYAHGLALGRGSEIQPGVTVEGIATAHAARSIATARGIDMPITEVVSAILNGQVAIGDAIKGLLARDLTQE